MSNQNKWLWLLVDPVYVFFFSAVDISHFCFRSSLHYVNYIVLLKMAHNCIHFSTVNQNTLCLLCFTRSQCQLGTVNCKQMFHIGSGFFHLKTRVLQVWNNQHRPSSDYVLYSSFARSIISICHNIYLGTSRYRIFAMFRIFGMLRVTTTFKSMNGIL